MAFDYKLQRWSPWTARGLMAYGFTNALRCSPAISGASSGRAPQSHTRLPVRL